MKYFCMLCQKIMYFYYVTNVGNCICQNAKSGSCVLKLSVIIELIFAPGIYTKQVAWLCVCVCHIYIYIYIYITL